MEIRQLKLRYFSEQVSKGIREVFARQLEATVESVYSDAATQERERRTGRLHRGRSGALLEALRNPAYSVGEKSGSLRAEASLPVYSRFLDMKRGRGRGIYNKPLFGTLYRDVRNNIRYEFRQWMQANREAVAESLRKG